MKPPAFEYLAAASVEEAIAALAAHDGDAKVIAGGQSLVPMLNFRLLEPALLVDINKVPGLNFIEPDGDGLRIGALTRHHALETSDLVRARFPVLSHAMSHVAHLAIRNRGTIGGSLSHADPAAELPMMAVLLNATIVIAGSSEGRELTAADFFEGALTTGLADDELVTEIRFPALPARTGWGFEEFAQRSGDFAMAAAAATISLSGSKAGEVRLALMGVGEIPLRVEAAEAALSGTSLECSDIDTAVAAVDDVIDPMSDVHASADYRRHLAKALTRRVLVQAWQRANGERP